METSTLAIIAILLRRRRKRRIHSRYAKRFYLSLDDDERRRRDRRIPRVALVEPNMSAWRRILASGNDQSLITTTGLDFSVFGELKGRFEPMYSQYSSVPVDGKYVKRKSCVTALAVAIVWAVAGWFFVSPIVLSVVLSNSRSRDSSVVEDE